MKASGTTLLLCCFVLALLGCKGAQTNAGANAVGSGACELLSEADIKDVQGEAVADRQSSSHANGAFVTSQCFYRLPTFSKSVNLEIMRPAKGDDAARAVAEFWERRFHQPRDTKSEAEIEREQERARAGNRNQQREGEGKGERERDREEEAEGKGSQPTPVPGIGDEAFWAGNQINSSLYVRNSNVIIRLSIGGPDEQSLKIKKATTLIQQVLKRL